VEFFTGALASSTTAAAIHFTEGVVQYDFPKAAELWQMRNDQIAHMNYARTTEIEEKLQANDMYLTAGASVRALKKFEENLRPNARKVWDDRTTGRRTIDPNLVYVLCVEYLFSLYGRSADLACPDVDDGSSDAEHNQWSNWAHSTKITSAGPEASGCRLSTPSAWAIWIRLRCGSG
jgi:hypothetical protein